MRRDLGFTKANFKAPLNRGIFVALENFQDAILKNGSFQANLLGSPYQDQGNNNLAPGLDTSKHSLQLITTTPCNGNVNSSVGLFSHFIGDLRDRRVKRFPKQKEVKTIQCWQRSLTTFLRPATLQIV